MGKSNSNERFALNLLDLPVDILTIILEYLLTSSKPIPLCPCSSSPVDPLPIFLAHPSLHAIACPLFYMINEFELDTTWWHSTHVRNLLCTPGVSTIKKGRHPVLNDPDDTAAAFLKSPNALRRIHRFRLRVDRLRGWLHTDLQPIVEDMAIKGNLTNLTLDFLDATADSTRPCLCCAKRAKPEVEAEAHPFTNQPVAGLLSLLADPYLRVAQLRIDHVHKAAWCRWHKRLMTCPETGKQPVKEETLSPRVRSESAHMLEVDWRGILKEIDPEGKNLANAISEVRI